MEAIEEGILGVYDVVVACKRTDGSISLVCLNLTDDRPTGMSYYYLFGVCCYVLIGHHSLFLREPITHFCNLFCATSEQQYCRYQYKIGYF